MHTPLFRWTNLATTVALVSALAACTADDGDDGAATDGSGSTADGGDDLAPDWNGGLTVQVMNENTAIVSWDAASDDTTPAEDLTYRIWWATESGAQLLDQAPQATTNPGATSITLSSLRPSKEHFFVVRAVDADGLESQNSEEASGLQPDTTAPDFDGVDTVMAIGGGAIQINWSDAVDNGADSDEIRYAVSVSTESGVHDWVEPTFVTEPGELSAEVGGLEELVPHFVTVRAIDTNGNTDNNVVERSVTPPDETPPAFDGATMAIGAGNAIQVQWNPATDNVSESNQIRYRVYLADMTGEQNLMVPAATTAPGATSQTLTGLSLSTEYFIVVRALDQAGNEDENTVEVSTFTGATMDETPPVFNGVLFAEAQTATTIRVAWDLATDDQTPPGNIVYDVYMSTTLGVYDFQAPIKTSNPGDAFTFVTGLEPETDYFFTVRARDVSGNQDANVIEAGAKTFPDTTAPTFAGISGAVGTSSTTVQLQWAPASDDSTPPGQIVYYVYSGDQGSINWASPIGTTSPGQTTFTVTGLYPLVNRDYGVRAVDEYLNEDANEAVSVAAALDDVTPPTFAGAQTVGDIGWNEATVFWNAASDDVSGPQDIYYDVYVVESGENFNFNVPTVTTTPGELKAQVTGLRPGYDYDVVVRARDEFDNQDTNQKIVTWTTDSDTTGPTFAGPTGFANIASTTLTPQWNAATDNAWGPQDISYQVCRSTLANGCGFGSGSWIAHASGTNITQAQLTGLTASTTYYVWVRATDGTGNSTTPNSPVNATTSNDVIAPTFAGATGTAPVAGCAGAASVTVQWAAGSDNSTPQASLVYDIWYSNVSGAAAITKANGSPADATSAAGATQHTVTGLAANTTYYFVVRARDFAGLRDSNTVTVSRTTAQDNCAPTGGNATGATKVDCLTLRASHPEATDNVTAHANMTYQVCASASSTGCSTNWNAVTNYRSEITGGATVDVQVANPGTWYVWVRPVDGAGNVGSIGSSTSINLTDDFNPSFSGSTFTATVSNAVAGRVSLSWSQATDACWPQSQIAYQLCNSADAACTIVWQTLADPGTAESYVWDTTHYDTNLTFYVRAIDPSGKVSTRLSVAATTAVDYDTQIAGASGMWETAACTGCHTWSRATTVGVAASCRTGWNRIVANNTSTSLMYRQMADSVPPCPSYGFAGAEAAGPASGQAYSVGRMPLGGPYVSGNWLILGRWINQGALDN